MPGPVRLPCRLTLRFRETEVTKNVPGPTEVAREAFSASPPDLADGGRDLRPSVTPRWVHQKNCKVRERGMPCAPRRSCVAIGSIASQGGSAMCTDLLVVSKDGKQVVSARSQEDNAPADYRLILRRKNVPVQLTLPKWDASDRQAKLRDPAQEESWTSKHDYAGLMMTSLPNGTDPVLPISNAVFDGMNDAGLSASSLLFRGAHYQEKSKTEKTRNVFVGFFIDWLLGNYSTCAEVRSAFEN